jgi:hypothetical protein
MDTRIQNVLDDLFKIDPQFKAHEKELRTLVSELLLAKPDTHFDEHFAQKLRVDLLHTKVKPKPVPTPYASFFVSRMFYGVLGSALTVLIAVPFTFVATQRVTSPEKDVVLNPFSTASQVKDVESGLTPKQQISNKGINAFGKLALVPTSENVANQDTAVAKDIAPMSTMAPSSSSPTITARNASSALSATYSGQKIELKDTQGKVFKRTKGIDSGKQLASTIKGSKFGLADLSTFGDFNLSTIELSENKPFGYTVSINFNDGIIAVNPQWQYWNTSKTTPLEASEIPDDKTLVDIANAFVQKHTIDMNVYGKPLVRKDQGAVIVVYPLILDTKEVYEEGGVPFGLYIAIDAREKKVSSVTNLTSQTYDSSLYNLETNFDTVVRVATSSLAHNAVGASSTQVVSLGTPKAVLMHYWLYDEAQGTQNELFIPALSFPVSYEKNSTGMPTSVVVPLVKDFLSKQTQTPVTGPADATSSPKP